MTLFRSFPAPVGRDPTYATLHDNSAQHPPSVPQAARALVRASCVSWPTDQGARQRDARPTSAREIASLSALVPAWPPWPLALGSGGLEDTRARAREQPGTWCVVEPRWSQLMPASAPATPCSCFSSSPSSFIRSECQASPFASPSTLLSPSPYLSCPTAVSSHAVAATFKAQTVKYL